MPGEVNLWKRMNRIIEEGNIPKPNDENSTAIVHLILHLGDFVSVEDTLRTYGMKLLDILTRDDSTDAQWLRILQNLETALVSLYRGAFSNIAVRDIFRKCGNLFLGGSGEAGVFTSSLFGIENAGPGITGLEESKKEEEKKREIELQKERDENRFQRKYGVKSSQIKKQTSETSSKDEDDVYDSEDTESEEEEDGNKDGTAAAGNNDKIRPTVGVEDSLKTNKKKLKRELLQHTEVERDLRRLTLGLMLRLARFGIVRFIRYVLLCISKLVISCV